MNLTRGERRVAAVLGGSFRMLSNLDGNNKLQQDQLKGAFTYNGGGSSDNPRTAWFKGPTGIDLAAAENEGRAELHIHTSTGEPLLFNINGTNIIHIGRQLSNFGTGDVWVNFCIKIYE